MDFKSSFKDLSDIILNECLSLSLRKLKLNFTPTFDQRSVIFNFVRGNDVFVSLPTGSGKSLCYTVLPYMFDFLKAQISTASTVVHSSIVIVVSPLMSLMKDQVAKYSGSGLACAFVGEEQRDENVKEAVVRGQFQLLYMSPESLLCVLRWREMFLSSTYQSNLVAVVVDEAHCVREW